MTLGLREDHPGWHSNEDAVACDIHRLISPVCSSGFCTLRPQTLGFTAWLSCDMIVYDG
jgi:hypothetical protein